MKILLKAPFSVYSGYGHAGIAMAKALVAQGHDLYLDPFHLTPPLPKFLAELLQKTSPTKFDLFIHFSDPMVMEAPEHVKSFADVSIGWSMWEMSSFGNMKAKPKSTLRKRMQNFDAYVGYSAIDEGCMRPYFKNPIIIQQGGFDSSLWPVVERDWNGPFRFCMHGQLSERKSPFTAIQAFSELSQSNREFAKDARLMLHTSIPGLHSKMAEVYPGLRIFYEIWPQDLVLEFYANSHMLLGPSRGEGQFLPAQEFMATGGTTITTNWSGPTQWLNPEYSYPLDYTLTPVDPSKKSSALWATPSVEHLKELMLHTFQNPDEVRRKGEIASQVIPKMCSWDSALEGLFSKLRTALPDDKGERLYFLSKSVGGSGHV